MKPRITLNLAVFIFGFVFLAAGLYLIYPPAALIGPGLILMAIALFGGRR